MRHIVHRVPAKYAAVVVAELEKLVASIEAGALPDFAIDHHKQGVAVVVVMVPEQAAYPADAVARPAGTMHP